MGFWTTSDDQNATDTGKSFEVGGGNMEPIPASTQLRAMIDDAKWDERNDEEYINLRWTVLEPEAYKNRKVFQKVRVLDSDEKKADKAKRMLAAIDANCGGKLAKSDDMPQDMDLQSALCNTPMLIQVQVWEMEGSDGIYRTGNWVNQVGNNEKPKPEPTGSDDTDDDIPF